MIEQTLQSLGPALPARLSHKLSPEDNPDAEEGDEGCSDLLSANQRRSTAKDGRRDVRSGQHQLLVAPQWLRAVSSCKPVCTGGPQYRDLFCAPVQGEWPRCQGISEHLPQTRLACH